MNKHRNYFLSLNPQDSEIITYGLELPLSKLLETVDSLAKPNPENIYLFYSYRLHELRGQTKEAEALKPVIEKEIDPDFFKPKRTCIL